MNEFKTTIGLVDSLRLATVATALLSAFTAQAAEKTWTGSANNLWDTSAANWSGDTTTYADGDTVRFDETSSRRVINVQAAGVAPASIVVSNTAATAYQFTNGTIRGAASLAKYGDGDLTLSGSNSFTGGITLNAGTLTAGGNNAYAFGNSAGSVITLNGGKVTVQNGTLGAFIVPEGKSATMVPGGPPGTSSLSGSGTLSVEDNSTSTRNFGSMTNNFSGTLILTNTSPGHATIWLPFDNVSPPKGSNMTLSVFGVDASHTMSAIYNLSGNCSIGALSGNAHAILTVSSTSSKTYFIGGKSSDTTFDGIIQDNGTRVLTIAKVGTGTLTLAGVNTYSGTTTISNGTLWVNGTHTGGNAYNVASNATLGGVGTIGSVVTNLLGGTLAPGTNSIGTLGTGNLTLNGTLKIRVGPAGASKVSVTGAVVLGSGSDLLVEEAGQLSSGSKVIVENDGTADAVTGQFKQGTKLSVGGNTYIVNYEGGDGNDITLTLRPKGTMIRFF
jgi:autotransporter-associated beta strand protein